MHLIPSNDRLNQLDYPVTTGELLAAAGDVELDLPNGSETLGDAVERIDYRRFDSPEEVRWAVLTGVGADAVGRRYYSDRDPPAVAEESYQQLSF
ncbi:MAG: DUF2795 domain-containing protein [Halolamina sp.]